MINGRKPTGKIDLNHLHLDVRNLDRAQCFYEAYFGFRKRVCHGDILFLSNTSGFGLLIERPFRFRNGFILDFG